MLRGPCLNSLLLTIVTSSLALSFYQKDERAKSGKFLAKRSPFFLSARKSLTSPMTFHIHLLFCLIFCLSQRKSCIFYGCYFCFLKDEIMLRKVIMQMFRRHLSFNSGDNSTKKVGRLSTLRL
jgi:hypothetical protein